MNVNHTVPPSPSPSYNKVVGGLAIPVMVILLLGFLALPLEFRDPIILALVMLVLVLSTRNFGVMWAAFIMYLPLVYLMTGMFGQQKISGLRIFLVVFLGIFLLLPKSQKFWPILFKNPAWIGLLLFWAANMLSAIISGELEAVFRVLTYLEPLAFFLISYFVVVRRPGNWRMLLGSIGIGGMYVALLGGVELLAQRPLAAILGIENTVYDLEIMQFYLSENRFGLGGRISSTLLQPVYAGLFFSLCAILQTYYITVYQKHLRGWLFVLLPLSLAMVLLTGSRGPILALGVALLAYLAYNRKKSFSFSLTVIGLGVLVFIVAYLVPGIQAYMRASFNLTEQESMDVLQRINITLGLIEFFKASPIFGFGPGLIQKAARQGVFGFAGLGGLENQYATILADGGLVAGVAYAVFIFGVFVAARRAYRSGNRELQGAGTALLVLAAYYFTVIISVNAILAVGGYLFMIVVGGLIGLCDHHSHYAHGTRVKPV